MTTLLPEFPLAGGLELGKTSRPLDFSFDEETAEDDTAVERDGVILVIDAMSFQYLAGSEVDYQEGLEGSRFVVNNPNATTTCGCGASFSI